LLVSALAIYSLVRGSGPFVANTQKESLMLVGSYIGILAVTNMLLAAAAAERRAAERLVSESEKRFRAAVVRCSGRALGHSLQETSASNIA